MTAQKSDLPVTVPSSATVAASSASPPSKWLGRLMSRSTVLTASALVLIIYFQQVSGGYFVTSSNFALLLRQTAVVAVVAAGMALLIIMGEIDLSVGSAAFFAGLVVAQCQVSGWGLIPSIAAGIAFGVALGLIQGIVIIWFGVPAFIVTLAGFLLWRGLGMMWSNATPIGPVTNDLINVTEGRMPPVLVYLLAAGVTAYGVWQLIDARNNSDAGRATALLAPFLRLLGALAIAAVVIWMGLSTFGLPNAVLWITAVALVLGGILGRAKIGRRIFLLGSNAEAAVYAGINSKQLVLFGFVVMGVIYGIAGTMLTARAGVASPDAGMTLELVAIAAAVIGGTSLRGGVGSIRGAVLGAFLLATMDNGMSLLGVASYAQNVVKGIILVIAVALDGYFRRRQSSRS